MSHNDKLKNLRSKLSNFKSKVDKLNVDKLVCVSNVIKRYAVKNDAYNAKIKNIEDKIPGIITEPLILLLMLK